MAYIDVVTADAPVHYWPLNGNYSDSGSTSNPLIGGTPPFVEALPALGQGISFNGSTRISTGVNTPSNAYSTLEIWVKTTEANGAAFLMSGHATLSENRLDAKAYVKSGKLSVDFYSASTSHTVDTNAVINDGHWHHVVITMDSGENHVYVDAIQKGYCQTAVPSANAGFFYFGGDRITGGYFTGYVADPARYNTVLTPTRIQAHYAAGNPPTVVDVAVGTTSLTSSDLSFVGAAPNVTTNVAAAKLSARASEVTVEAVDTTTVVALVSTADRLQSGAGAATSMSINASTGYMNFDMSEFAGLSVVSATLDLRQTSASTGGTTTIGRVIGAWNETDFTVTNTTLDSTVTATFTNETGAKSIDVTQIVQAIVDSGDFNGFWLDADNSGTVTLATREHATASYRPTLRVAYGAGPTNVDLAPASMTLATSDVVNEFSHDSVVDAAQSTVFVSEASVDTNSVLALDAAAINAEAPLPTVEAVLTPDAIAELDAAVVLFAGTNSTASIPVEIDVDVATLSVTSPDANIQVRYNTIAVLDTPKILVYRNELESVNGDPIVADENDDAYFNAVMLNEPSVWYRFNDQTNPVKPRVPLNGDSAHISNAVMGLNDGPNGRRYVHFNGTAMFTQPGEPFWSDNDENYAANGTLEFSIRTSKRNQFIMRMDDAQAGILFGVDTGPRDLYLKDGRLELRQYGVVLRPNVATPDVLFTGMADIADDRWHHIVLTYEDDRQGDRYSVGRVNLYIDGELDIRKYKTSGFGFPDWIGGRPSYPSTWSAYFDLPQTQWFVGDIAEVAYYNNNYFQLDTVTRHYDTLIGRDPVYLEAAKVEFDSPDAIIKGNKTRVLVLDFGGGIGGGSGAIYQRNGKPIEKDEFAGDYKTGYNSFSFDGYGKWIRDPNYGISGQRVGRQRAWDNDGMLIYNISVTEDYDTSGSYVNERLDTPRLLDLDVDLNMADYDVISIVDFPQGALGPEYAMMDEGVEFGAPTATQQFERLIEQVRKQVVAGKGLMLADPASAIALGIIDRAEYVPSYIESTSLDQRLGAVTGFYDAFGENGKRGPASTEISHIARYRDQHANMFQRVRTAVPGLTDRKGFWIQTDTSLWRNVDPFATPNARYKYRHEDRTETGLLLDDEFYLRGNGDINPVESFWDSIGSGTPRNNGWVATPIANIKSGVAVTSFAPKVGMKDEMVDNPYKEYAVSIAVRPGDSLKGETIAGKVYVNFTEAYVNWASTVDLMPREIIPEDGWDKNRRFYVPEEDRYWTYSETRGNWVGDTIVFSAPIDNSNWDSLNSGEVTSAGKVGSSKKMYEWKWAMMNYMSAFEIEPVRVAPMSFRALLWLTEDIQQDGNAVAGLQPAKATAGAKDVTVSTTASTEVFVGTARTTMDILPMRDVTEPDTTALVGTPTVRVQAKEFMEVVDLDAARITLNAPETDNDRLASVDRIFVTLPVHKITLILEEE